MLPKPSSCFTGRPGSVSREQLIQLQQTADFTTELPPAAEPCPLSSISSGFSRPEGSGENGVLVLAEALGQHEAEAGLPLRPYAQAGSVFDRAVRAVGLNRNSFRIFNTVNCRPPNDWLAGASWEYDAIQHCKQHVDQVARGMDLKLVLALGSTACREQTGWAGHKKGLSFIRGFALDSPTWRRPDGRPVPVLSTYHPSFLARGKTNLTGVFQDDILNAFRLAQLDGRWSRPDLSNFRIQPPVDWCNRWASEVEAHLEWDITYDIETRESLIANDESEVRATGRGMVTITPTDMDSNPESGVTSEEIMEEMSEAGNLGGPVEFRTEITQIQFSVRPGMAVVVPWSAEYRPFIHRMMKTRNRKFGFNCYGFDDPLLMGAGVEYGSHPHDLMWMWHHWQPDLPRGLQYVSSFFIPEYLPWKHLADSDEGFYGGCDVDAPQRIKEGLEKRLREKNLWWAYERHVYALWISLRSASIRGWPVDQVAQTELKEAITVEQHKLFAELQAMVPAELRKLAPAKGYRSEKVALKAYQAAWKKIQENHPDMEWERYEIWQQRSLWIEEKLKKKELLAQQAAGSAVTTRTTQVTRWFRQKPFLPGSSQQMVAYLKLKKYAVPMDPKKKRPTTAKKEILKLAVKHEDRFLQKSVEFKEFHKIRSTYMWQLDDNTTFQPVEPITTPEQQAAWDRIRMVHTQFTYAPGTGQLSSRAPNIQNQPKNGMLAKKHRKTVRAKPGYRLIELDYTAYHALTLGFEAKDPTYMWIAARDIHSFVAGHLLKVPGYEKWRDLATRQDEELTQILKWWKRREEKEFHGARGPVAFKWYRDFKAKPAILGIGFGLGDTKLWLMNEESYASKKEAGATRGMIKELFPKVFAFQDWAREEAYQQKCLISKHRYIRWFWDVYRWQRLEPGVDWRKSSDIRRGNDGEVYRKVWGNDSEAAIAFLPANDAFGHMKEVMIDMEAAGLMERYGFINNIHDALVFHCPIKLAEECVETIRPIMERKSLVLKNAVVPDGLSCGVEASWGENWAEMELVH